MVKFWKLQDALSIAFLSASLLLSEIIFNKFVTYQLSSAISGFVPILIFASLSLGNILGLTKKAQQIPRWWWANIISFVMAFSLWGFSNLPEICIVFLILPFMFYGIYLTLCYAEASLRNLVTGLGGGGVLFYLSYELFFKFIIHYQITFLLAVTSLGAVFLTPSWRRWGFFFFFLCFGLISENKKIYAPKLFIEKHLEGLQGAKRVMEPLYTPLIRTDLYRTIKNKYIIITNGQRFSVVEPNDKENVFKPSYDMPYLFLKAKKVLIIGSAGGHNVTAALKFGASSVTAVDINPFVFSLIRENLKAYAGNFYNHPNVVRVVKEGRHFVETSKEKFDLIVLQGVQTGTHGSPINVAMLESFLFTKEAVKSLWNHLTPHGGLWIEEYRYKLSSSPEDTLIQEIATTARANLGIDKFENHHRIFEYSQDVQNPSGSRRKWREGLLLSREPLEKKNLEIAPEFFSNVQIKKAFSKKNKNYGTDDHPYFIVENKILYFVQILGQVVSSLLFILAFYFFCQKSETEKKHLNLALFFIGLGFILLISGFVGPLSLLLGDPQISSPVLFISIYFFGTCGGLIALKVNKRWAFISLAVLTLYLFIFPSLMDLIKPNLLSLESIVTRVIIAAFFLMPAGLLAELPYIQMLNGFENKERAKAYTLQNIGTLMGVPLSIYLQLMYGFKSVLIGASLAYGIAFISFLRTKNSSKELLSPFFLKLILLSGFVSSLVYSDFYKLSNYFQTKKETLNCKKSKPHDFINVPFKNAQNLEKDLKLDVLVGPSGGCYLKGASLPLYGIARSKFSDTLYQREKKMLIAVNKIIEKSFDQLDFSQKKYALRKFGPSAKEAFFDVVGLRFLARVDDKGDKKREHPGATSLNTREDVSAIFSRNPPPVILTFNDVKITGHDLKKLKKIVLSGIHPEIQDPESNESGFFKGIENLPKDKTFLVVGKDKEDLRAYNVLTQMSIKKYQNLFWYKVK